MTKAFEQGLDLHRLTASQMTGKAFAEVADKERKGAKCVNFGSVYGQGAGGLVQTAWDQFDIVREGVASIRASSASRSTKRSTQLGIANLPLKARTLAAPEGEHLTPRLDEGRGARRARP